MHVMKLSGTNEVVCASSIGERTVAVPAFVDGRIYLRGARSLYCVGTK